MAAIINLSSEKRAAAAGPLLKTVFNIFEVWGLRPREQQILLGINNEGTFYNWKKHPETATISNDLLERTSYILGIWKALQILIPEHRISDSWISAVNHGPAFNGQTPLERMLGGHVVDLAYVRQYLDAERGGWR
jgi:hypothetical protein